MKIKLARVAKKSAITPVNTVITFTNATIRFAPLVWVFSKFLVRWPKWTTMAYRDVRSLGMYSIMCDKFELRMPLQDSVAIEAMTDPNNHATRQLVLQQFIEEMSYLENAEGFKPPKLYQFNRLKIERIRDASSTERKKYLDSSLRSALEKYIEGISGV